jgi:phosphoglycolate phosphatase-like HAD superfamily hydrolase
MHPMTLITFDVDGTLVRGSTHSPDVTIHAKAFLHAAGKVMVGEEAFETKYSSPLDFVSKQNYHGCTDGLIALHLIKNAFNIPIEHITPKLPAIFQSMYEFVSKADDSEIRNTILPIEGVLETLQTLQQNKLFNNHLLCGLVTGNVEGIARKKMRATGIYDTGIFSTKASDQTAQWLGTEDCPFLGGFGSDYCSCNVEDISRQYKDRGEQIAIAYQRAQQLITNSYSYNNDILSTFNQKIVRVVHVGDAPADVLAAKYCATEGKFGSNVVVSCIAVATGSYSVEELQEACGDTIVGVWEPVVLEQGVADPKFIASLKIRVDYIGK